MQGLGHAVYMIKPDLIFGTTMLPSQTLLDCSPAEPKNHPADPGDLDTTKTEEAADSHILAFTWPKNGSIGNYTLTP